MALAPRINRVSLAFMGEGWEEAYINFRMLKDGDQQMIEQLSENKDLDEAKKAITMLKTLFISGRGLGVDGSLVDITPDDVAELDLWTINELVKRAGQEPSPKASPSLSASTADQAPDPTALPGSNTESASV